MAFAQRIKKLASETAIYGISSVAGRLINFLLFPFYSNVFAVEIWGIASVIYASFIFFNIVFQYGMEAAYLKFASLDETETDKRVTFSTGLLSLATTAIVLSAILLLARSPLSSLFSVPVAWEYLFFYVAAILLVDTVNVIPLAELRLSNRPWTFAGIKIANILINVGLNLYLILGLKMGIEAIFIANLAASVSSTVLLLPTILKWLRPVFNRKVWGELLAFGLPFVPGGLGYAIADRINVIFLGKMDPEKILSLYGSETDLSAIATQPESLSTFMLGSFGGAAKFGVFMALVVQMFRYAWQPFFLQHAQDNDARQLFSRVFTIFVGGALFVFLGVSFFTAEIAAVPLPGGRTLIAPDYWLGLSVVPIILIGYLFQGLYYNFAVGAYVEKKTRYFVHCALAGAVVALIINAIGVPNFGMAAAAWATAGAYLTMAIMLLMITRRFYKIDYDWSSVGIASLVALGAFGVWYLFPNLRIWWVELLLLFGFALLMVLLKVIPWPASGEKQR